nr:hypothetical protein GCM10010200_048290 [Actinomadura rugatobispora]
MENPAEEWKGSISQRPAMSGSVVFVFVVFVVMPETLPTGGGRRKAA